MAASKAAQRCSAIFHTSLGIEYTGKRVIEVVIPDHITFHEWTFQDNK